MVLTPRNSQARRETDKFRVCFQSLGLENHRGILGEWRSPNDPLHTADDGRGPVGGFVHPPRNTEVGLVCSEQGLLSKLQPMGQVQLPLVLANFDWNRAVLLPLPVVCAAFVLRRQNLVVLGTVWPAKPRIFTVWPFTEEACHLSLEERRKMRKNASRLLPSPAVHRYPESQLQQE